MAFSNESELWCVVLVLKWTRQMWILFRLADRVESVMVVRCGDCSTF